MATIACFYPFNDEHVLSCMGNKCSLSFKS